MNAKPVTVRRIGLGLVAAAALLTSGCAAGQQAATANESATLDGVNKTLGNIALRGLAIAPPPAGGYPVGSNPLVKLVIVNTGTDADALTEISTPVATTWAAYRTVAEAGRVLADAASSATASESPSAPVSDTASAASGSPSGSSSTSGSRSAAPSSTAPAPPNRLPLIPLAPGRRVSWGVPEATGAMILLDTTRILHPGTTIRVTFTFRRAGTITVPVPIQLTSSPNFSFIPSPSGPLEGG